SFDVPAHAGSFEAVFDDVAAGAFDDSAGDRVPTVPLGRSSVLSGVQNWITIDIHFHSTRPWTNSPTACRSS
ncbi:MAG: hypothetical protein KDB27_29510, partial [Planctomycetales bacterium]|nr:hypothetical protein [Planctomycetales bacterium]